MIFCDLLLRPSFDRQLISEKNGIYIYVPDKIITEEENHFSFN